MVGFPDSAVSQRRDRTMHKEGSVFGEPSASLTGRYTSKPLSGWGGVIAVVRYMGRLGVRALLRQELADGRTSPNQIPAVDIALAFLVAVLTGARRFAHIGRLGGDEVISGILAMNPR